MTHVIDLGDLLWCDAETLLFHTSQHHVEISNSCLVYRVSPDTYVHYWNLQCKDSDVTGNEYMEVNIATLNVKMWFQEDAAIKLRILRYISISLSGYHFPFQVFE